MIESSPHEKPRCWGWRRFALYTGLLAVVYFASQVIGVVVAMTLSIVREGGSVKDLPEFDINAALGPVIVSCCPASRWSI